MKRYQVLERKILSMLRITDEPREMGIPGRIAFALGLLGILAFVAAIIAMVLGQLVGWPALGSAGGVAGVVAVGLVAIGYAIAAALRLGQLLRGILRRNRHDILDR